MTDRILVASCIALAALVCMFSCPQATPSDSSTSSSGASSITFFVGSSSTSQNLAGVSVFQVTRSGELIRLGETNLGGRFSYSKEELKRGGQVILFCKERYFCGALRLDEPGVFEYDRQLIHLAPFALM